MQRSLMSQQDTVMESSCALPCVVDAVRGFQKIGRYRAAGARQAGGGGAGQAHGGVPGAHVGRGAPALRRHWASGPPRRTPPRDPKPLCATVDFIREQFKVLSREPLHVLPVRVCSAPCG